MSLKAATVTFCLLAVTLAAGKSLPVERVIRIDLPSHDAVYSLVRQTRLDVIDAQERFVTAYASDAKIAQLRQLGHPVTILVEDYQKQAALDLVNYYTYAQVCSILNAVALTYPGITKLETLGFSAGNRPIPAIKVSENPLAEHDRPCIRLIGAHHGNEKIGTEICLAFMQYLCDSYPSNPQVQYLVDSREFWVVPVFNPDGHVANSRSNGNGTDLNRDYGYEWDDETGNGIPFSEPETRAMHAHAERRQPTLEYEYHSTASYVNYLWDNTPVDPPDSGFVAAVSRRYCDSTYGSSLTRLNPINGYAWYEVHGSCQDHTFGAFGALATTVETQLPTTRVKIDSICAANRRALFDMSTMAGWGVSGVVYDSATHAPLFARIEFTSPRRWNTYTDATTGGFHKMVAPGTYSVRIAANGYTPRTFDNVVVSDTGAAALDVPLTRPQTEPLNCAQRIIITRRNDNSHNLPGVGPDALGEPDGRFYTLGSQQSYVVFDVDPSQPVRNRDGDDITVHATGGYTLAASNNWQSPWQSLGSASGNHSFDLSAVSMDSARYLRVADNGSCALDAIGYVGSPPVGISEAKGPLFGPLLTLLPNPARSRVRITLALPASGSPARLSIYDATGRLVLHSPFVYRDSAFTQDIRSLCAGVYFCVAECGGLRATAKLAVER